MHLRFPEADDDDRSLLLKGPNVRDRCVTIADMHVMNKMFIYGLETEMCKNITTLQLSRSYGMNIQSYHAIGNMLKVNHSLKEIELGWNHMDDHGVEEIVFGLRYNRTVTTLDLSRNKIGFDGCRAIGQMLLVNRTLRELNLGNNHFGDKGTQCIVNAMDENYRHTQMTVLDLSCNNIRVDGCKAIGQMLRRNASLQQLNMGWNHLGSVGTMLIMDGMIQNSHDNNHTALARLDLSCNKILLDGCQAIGRMIQVNRSLQELNLYFNAIDDDGVESIMNGLYHNCSVTKVNLHLNRFRERGCRAIQQLLYVNTSLRELDLQRNQFGEKGSIYLADALRHNTTIHLYMNESLMTDDITFYLLRNQAVRHSLLSTTLTQSQWVQLLITVCYEPQQQFQLSDVVKLTSLYSLISARPEFFVVASE